MPELHIKHHFTTAYHPWANGSVERVCRETYVVRPFAHAVCCSQSGLSQADWPAVNEALQSLLNHAPLKMLGRSKRKDGRTSLTTLDQRWMFAPRSKDLQEVFSSHWPTRLLLRALPVKRYRIARPESEIAARQVAGNTRFQESMEAMHRDIEKNASTRRAR